MSWFSKLGTSFDTNICEPPWRRLESEHNGCCCWDHFPRLLILPCLEETAREMGTVQYSVKGQESQHILFFVWNWFCLRERKIGSNKLWPQLDCIVVSCSINVMTPLWVVVLGKASMLMTWKTPTCVHALTKTPERWSWVDYRHHGIDTLLIKSFLHSWYILLLPIGILGLIQM